MNSRNVQLSRQEIEEMIDDAEAILGEVAEAAERLRRMAERLGDQYMMRTLVASLEIVVDTGGWVHRDLTIPQLIRMLQRRKLELRA